MPFAAGTLVAAGIWFWAYASGARAGAVMSQLMKAAPTSGYFVLEEMCHGRLVAPMAVYLPLGPGGMFMNPALSFRPDLMTAACQLPPR